jgi:hypothetical protein
VDPAAQYRVISRARLALIAVPVIAVGALVVWSAPDLVEVYTERFLDVDNLPAEQALEVLAQQLKIIAIAQLVPLVAFSGFVIWYSRQAIRTRSLPPVGSWVLEGQRIRTGSDAIRVARILIALATAMVVVGAAAALFMWRLALDVQGAGAGV